MDSNRKTAIIVGASLLIAYGVLGGAISESLAIPLEVISGIAVIVIPVVMFPLFKPYNEKLTLVYVVLKVIEGMLLIIAAMLLLSPSPLLLGIRDSINVYHAYVFILASMALYVLLYQSKLVPRFISVWGVIALVSLLIANLLEVTGYSHPILLLLYLPIVSNEVFLAIWLIVKGFNPSAIASGASKI